jgi:protein tyrosine/serine phosphatase
MALMAKAFVLGVTLAASGLAHAGALAPAAAPAQSELRRERSDLVRFHEVDPGRLYRSGRLNAAAIRELQAKGIQAIVSLEDYDAATAQREAAMARAAGMTHTWYPMSGYDAPTVEQLRGALDAIAATGDKKVVVHCFRGADRTGMVVGAYRVVVQGWSPDDAIAEMRALGHLSDLYFWDDVLRDL